MIRAIALLALSITSCGIVQDLDVALDDSPPEGHTIIIRACAQDSAQAADTAQYEWCDTKPVKL